MLTRGIGVLICSPVTTTCHEVFSWLRGEGKEITRSSLVTGNGMEELPVLHQHNHTTTLHLVISGLAVIL